MARGEYLETEREREEGHLNAREKNFQGDTPDENLACDMGIDVAG